MDTFLDRLLLKGGFIFSRGYFLARVFLRRGFVSIQAVTNGVCTSSWWFPISCW